MDLSKFKNKPVSDKVLKNLITKVFEPSFHNVHVNLISARGAGKPFELRYLLNNAANIPNYPKNRVYLWLNLKDVKDDPTVAFKSSLTSLATYFGTNLSSDSQKLLVSLSAQEKITHLEFISFLQFLITQENIMLSFIK
jgi:hypothetical protein